MHEAAPFLDAMIVRDDFGDDASNPVLPSATLLNRIMVNAALRRRPGLLEAARQPSTVVLVVPDSDWGLEVAAAWRLLVDPISTTPLNGPATNGLLRGAGNRCPPRERRPGRRCPVYRMVPFRQTLREGQEASPTLRPLVANGAPSNAPSKRSARQV